MLIVPIHIEWKSAQIQKIIQAPSLQNRNSRETGAFRPAREREKADEEGDDADEFALLVQQFTFHKGEKVRVWWESQSQGVWLIGEIDRVIDKSVKVC